MFKITGETISFIGAKFILGNEITILVEYLMFYAIVRLYHPE